MNLSQLDRKGLPKPPWQVKRNKRKHVAFLFNTETCKQLFMGSDSAQHRRELLIKANTLNTQWFITTFVGPN